MRSLPLPNLSRPLAAAVKAGALAALALVLALAIRDQPLVGLAVPAVLATAVLSARWPVATITLILLLSGIYGTLQAYGSPSIGPLVDVILIGSWISVLLTHLVRVRERDWGIWPGLALLVLFIAITFIEIGTARSLEIGLKSFSYGPIYMTAVPLLALAGWRLRAYLDISRGIVLVTLVVAGYAVLRLIIGPAAREAGYALQSAGPYTTVGGDLSLVGSLPSRHALAFWVACAAPVCLAVALNDRRQRATAAVAVGLCLAAVYGTDVRTALAAVVAGSAIVIVLHQLSAGVSGRAIGQTAAALAVAAAGGALLFSTVVGSDSGRYGAILSPSGDPSWEAHVKKWGEALRDLDGNPFGNGLGSGGRLAREGETGIVTIASYNLDNSYLKVAYEQGLFIAAFFIATLIALLVGLGRRAVRARSPGVRALGIGAGGALGAAMVMFLTALYIEDLITFVVWVPLGAALGAIGAEQSAPDAPPASPRST